MHSILVSDGFSFFGLFYIRYYGLLMACAMLLALFISMKLCKKRNIDPNDIVTLAIIVLPLAVVCARLYYVIFSGQHYTFVEIFDISNGVRGLAIYGGVIGGFLGVIIFSLIKKDIKILGVLCDIIAPSLLLGQAIGRWGNFFNQEAYGYMVTDPKWQWFPFAVFIEGEGWHLATFFYESMWNLIGVFILFWVFHKSKQTGTTTAVYFIYYGIGRTFIEGLRTDSLYLFNSPIRVSQALSVLLVMVGIAILIYNSVRKKRGIGNEK